MFLFTIIVILAGLFITVSLSVLTYTYRSKPIAQNVSDVYNKEEYSQWLSYTMEITRLSIFGKVVGTAVLLLFLSLEFFPALNRLTQTITQNILLQTVLFLGLYMAAMYLPSIGFHFYRIFSVEQRYGFNTSTVKIFITDQIKTILLTALVGGSLLYLLLYLYSQIQKGAVFYTWLILMALVLVSNILYTWVFIRLFYKITPLTEGELYERTKSLAEQTGYQVKAIGIMNASKRSTKLNAFFTGFGRFRRIILYDTLLDKCSTDEIVSILAHEIGHAKHKDSMKGFLAMAIQSAAFLFLLSFFLSSNSFALAFGFEQAHYGFAIILFLILMEPVRLMLGIPLSAFSRHLEYKADAFAAESTNCYNMIQALKVLARENYANLTPHPMVVRMTYSHPPIGDRVSALEKLQQEKT